MKNMLLLASLFAFSVTMADASEVRKKIHIAAAKFMAQNTTAQNALLVDDCFRTALVNTNLFSVVDRDDMEAILSEQKFQASGATEQETAVRMGKLLNAEKIVTGSLSSFDQDYYIHVKVIDIETGEVQCAENITCGKKSELPEKSEELARLIAEKITGEKPAADDYYARRKKFGISAFAITPIAGLASRVGNASMGGYDFQVQSKDANNAMISPGIGISIFPWRNIFFDVYFFDDFAQTMNATVTYSKGSTIRSQDFTINYQQSANIAVNVNYVVISSRQARLFGGIGCSRSIITVNSRGTASIQTPDYVTFSALQKNVVNAFVCQLNTGFEWRSTSAMGLSIDANFPLSALSTLSNQGHVYRSSSNNYGETAQEVSFIDLQKLPFNLRLALTYYFNI